MTNVRVASWARVWSMRIPISSPRLHVTVQQVRPDQLSCDIRAHDRTPSVGDRTGLTPRFPIGRAVQSTCVASRGHAHFGRSDA